MAEDLSQAAASTDNSWLADLFRRDGPRLSRRLRKRLRDAEAAADLLQDAFERLASLRAPDALRSPDAYLQRVLRNLEIDGARRARCRPSDCIPLQEALLPPVAPAQEQAIEAQDLMRLYCEAVSALTPRTREVFLLHRVDELTYSEIGRRLGISVATVEYHICRALVHLDKA
ncbi:MAG: sigma-70 family RNA polymerase sigma factor, partial [Pseudomonadota bacterium]|nr:sigma-70 family RNA polymerase sigma factor [Pseudomonadota bacterium]